MTLASAVLGGGGGNRLFVKLRRKGLSYTAPAWLDLPRQTRRAELNPSDHLRAGTGAVEQARTESSSAGRR